MSKDVKKKKSKKKKSMLSIMLTAIFWTAFLSGGLCFSVWFFVYVIGDQFVEPEKPTGVAIETNITTEQYQEITSVDDNGEIVIIITPTAAPEVVETEVQSVPEVIIPPASDSGENKPHRTVNKYIFLGDSRFEGMVPFKEVNDIFLTEVGSGYDFLLRMKETALASGDANTALIIGLGVNGVPSNIDGYVTTINEMASRFPGRVFFTTVTPVDEAVEAQHGYHVKNESIDYFNQAVTSRLNSKVSIIDINSFMREQGVVSTDGVHYPTNVSAENYRYIKAAVAYNF